MIIGPLRDSFRILVEAATRTILGTRFSEESGPPGVNDGCQARTPLCASRYTVASRLRYYLLRVWVHCPRASNGLLPPRSYLEDYVRWYARSDSVLLFLLQTIIPTAFSSQMVVPTAINSYGLLMRNRRGDSCAANSLRHAKVSTARQATQNVAIPIAEHPDCGL